MSVENAKQYLKMLDTDKEFFDAINKLSGDKPQQMKLINDRGLEFTKEEFKEALVECVQSSIESMDKRKLDDSELDSVNAAGFLGDLLSAIPGVVACIVTSPYSAGAGIVETIGALVDGEPIDGAIKQGVVKTAETGAGITNAVNNWNPF